MVWSFRKVLEEDRQELEAAAQGYHRDTYFLKPSINKNHQRGVPFWSIATPTIIWVLMSYGKLRSRSAQK